MNFIPTGTLFKLYFRSLKYYLLNIVLTVMLFLIFFNGMKQDEFLLLHDHFFVLSEYDNMGSFFTVDPIDLGTSNTIATIVTFWDRLVYTLLFNLGFDIYLIQRLIVFILLTLSLNLPLLGFRKISISFDTMAEPLTLYIISLFYSFNTYTLIFWNSGVLMSISPSLTYYLAPLAFVTYHNAVFKDSKFIDKAKSCLLLFVMSFAIWLSFVFVFFLMIYSILYTLFNSSKFKKYLFNLSVHSALYLPLAFIFLSVPYDIIINSTTISVNSDQIGTGGMYTVLRGGLLYQMLMWFWWPIYTYWEPRNILTFHNYFKEPLSIIAPLLLYCTLLFYYIKSKTKNIQTLILFPGLLIMLLFIKGAQAPFGNSYLMLLKYMPMSSIFRTPDNKFAFGIILIISLLFVFSSNKKNKNVIVAVLLFVITVQCYPLFTGLAIQGENSDVSRDRIVSIPDEYSKLASYINSNKDPYGYIISFPPISFGIYRHDQKNNDGHIGQDILAKLSSLPFLCHTKYGGMSQAAYNILNTITNDNLVNINLFPVKYILIRKDIVCEDCFIIDPDNIPGRFKKVFESNLFTMYEDPLSTPIISSNNTQINFKIINPVKYEINLSGLNEESNINFAQSYRNSWALYPLGRTHNRFISDINIALMDLSYLWKRQYFKNTHTLQNNYANSWKINAAYIKENIPGKYYKRNSDGSIDINFVLYNKTQSLFYITALISFTFAFILLLFVICSKMKLRTSKWRNK